MRLWKRSMLCAVLCGLFLMATAAQGQDYYFRFTTPPASVICSDVSIPHIQTSSFVVEYNLPIGAAVNSYLVSSSGAEAFAGSVAVTGGTGSRVIPNFFAVNLTFPFSVTLRYDTLIAGQRVSSSAMTFTCEQANFTLPTPASPAIPNPSSGSSPGGGRINPQDYAPAALFCSGTSLSAYVINAQGLTLVWTRDLNQSAAAGALLVNQGGVALSKTPDGRYSVLADQADGKQYLFVFNGCPAAGVTESYVSDPSSGQFVRVE